MDPSTHPFCMNGHIGTKGAGVSTMWREGRKELEVLLSCSEIDLVGFLLVPFFSLDGFEGQSCFDVLGKN